MSAKKKSVKKPVKKTKFRKPTAVELEIRNTIFNIGMKFGNFVTLSDSQVLIFGKNEYAEFCSDLQQLITTLIVLNYSEKKESL